jgi:hypothetical protein
MSRRWQIFQNVMIFFSTIAIIAGIVGIIGAMRSCGDGCELCWDDENGFFSELFNSDPMCTKCSNPYNIITADGSKCVE